MGTSRDTTSKEYLDLKAELRSLLISSQQGCTERQLLRDYAEYNAHKEIPFRDMGYSNLLELLQSMPDVARFDRSQQPMVVHGVADQNTAHIKKLVSGQRKKPRQRSGRGPIGRMNYANLNSMFGRQNVVVSQQRYRQVPPAYPLLPYVPHQPYHQVMNTNVNLWETFDFAQTQQPLTMLPVPSINRPPASVATSKTSSTTAPKTVASFPPKKATSPPPNRSAMPIVDDNSSMIDEDMTYSEDDDLASFDAQKANEHGEKIILLRQRFRQLLLNFPNGLWLSSIYKLYKKTYDEELDLDEFKLKNLMAFFECVEDFVDSKRDLTADSTDRILLLKSEFIDAVKREKLLLAQPRPAISTASTHISSVNGTANSTAPIEPPVVVDLSAFVPLDFHFNRIEIFNTTHTSFYGFLGDVDDPWSMHIGNVQFQPKRDQLMAQLQEHYTRSANQLIYVIPFEQLEINLSCVYYYQHDKQYYRAFIAQIDPLTDSDVVLLRIFFVDYGLLISNIPYDSDSTSLKFLHQDFASLATQIYPCRLSNIDMPPTSLTWPDDARQMIIDRCESKQLFVEMTGFIDPNYCIRLSIVDDRSMNDLLIENGLAIKSDDSKFEEVNHLLTSIPYLFVFSSKLFPRQFHHCIGHYPPATLKNNSSYIDESLLARRQYNTEYLHHESNLKHFAISIEYAFHLVKQPFTKRPCLTCFEVARLLKINERDLPALNLVRETNLPWSEYSRTLFDELRRLPESSHCPHINRDDKTATCKLYDLSSIRDYLCKIKFNDGDVMDAFRQEYDSYDRPGYWNKKQSAYTLESNLQDRQERLAREKDVWTFRREQLISLVKSQPHSDFGTEIQAVEQRLQRNSEESNSISSSTDMTNTKPLNSEIISTFEENGHDLLLTTNGSTSCRKSTASSKMRETLFRIARPFDQLFSINIRFDHKTITNENDLVNDDIDERFNDLHRITKNVIQLLCLELETTSNETIIAFYHRIISLLPHLISNDISMNDRIDAYNSCLEIIKYLQPTILSIAQRTDSLDSIC